MKYSKRFKSKVDESLTDLHICKNSEPVSTASGTDSCPCLPEYYCTYICGEGGDYSIQSPISWQHFPRSTSSRSRCDDSSEEIVAKSASESTPSLPKEEKLVEEESKKSANEYPITKSFAQLRAQHYLEIRHIYEFINFLISHLVCNEPQDPVQFLVDLLGECIKYRDSFGEPPLLFTHNHVKSLYTAFDPFERGYLTQDQYTEAMKSLGLDSSITPYNKEPPLNNEGFIDEGFFISESNRCLTENLKKMLRIPKLREENRLLFQTRMRKRMKGVEKESDAEEEYYGEGQGNVERGSCKCAHAVENRLCRCSQAPEIKCELEQLFLD